MGLVMTRVKVPFPELRSELLQKAMEVGGGGGMMSWGWSQASIGDWCRGRLDLYRCCHIHVFLPSLHSLHSTSGHSESTPVPFR